MPRAAVIALLALALTGVGATPASAADGDAASAAKKRTAKKIVKKKCKKTHRLVKGKCVRRKKAKAPVRPKPVTPTPDPLSDADGDGIPYKWETVAAAVPPTPGPPRRCASKQRLLKGKCVPKCKKGRVLQRGKCVKRKKVVKRKRAKAKASLATESVATLGASPSHKDIFVQVDYANPALRQNVSCVELDRVVAAFANAPVSNPDGKAGIDLHIDAGPACGSRYDLGGSAIFDAGACPSFSQALNEANLAESRVGTFHIAAFAPSCGGSGGVGNLHGTKMVVFTEGADFAHVLMHELGHNLGLDHPYPLQPNRLSTMSTHLFADDDGSGGAEVLDFQRFDLSALDENDLSEIAGISVPPEARRFYVQHQCEGGDMRNAWSSSGSIDWDCDSPQPPDPPVFETDTVAADVNGDGVRTVLPATGNEWIALDYGSGGEIGPR